MKRFGRIQRLSAFVLMMFFFWLLAGCVATSGQNTAHESLAGKIRDRQAGRFVDRQVLMQALRQADYVLLGETHDNPEHHAIEKMVLEVLLQSGRRPTLVLEMLDLEDQPAVDRVLQDGPVDAERFNRASGFAKKGWDWPLYRPLIETALSHGLRIVAGNLSREQLAAVIREGFAGAPKAVQRQVANGRGLEPGQRETLMQDIRTSHCDKLPEQMVPGMANAQIARDIMLAEQLVQAGKPALLIAGAGHVRRDRGVPFYLSQMDPGARVVSIGMFGVDAGTAPEDVVSYRDRFDYLWYTKSVKREDPCAGFNVNEKG